MEYHLAKKPKRYLNFRSLQEKIGNRSRSQIYRDIEAGRLPKPIKFGARLYWAEADIDAALEAMSK
ncbi:helix-turn-helix transcriptional regulator [Marimonas arenosa]|uniref:AlpA family phage regulatory protein n=1 Tax=Marimonas arenosa TaxID=1795305 RepID=A0AAE4B5M9_9RHOB|nr:AlpA family phage regulatory protein [Marimonas arenosa]MDQ2091342.1 AlpA family phage regulatory protein [Marimonas arenosa]